MFIEWGVDVWQVRWKVKPFLPAFLWCAIGRRGFKKFDSDNETENFQKQTGTLGFSTDN